MSIRVSIKTVTAILLVEFRFETAQQGSIGQCVCCSRAAEEQEDKDQQQFYAGHTYTGLHAQADQEHGGTQCVRDADGMKPGVKIRETVYANAAGDAKQCARYNKQPAGNFNDNHGIQTALIVFSRRVKIPLFDQFQYGYNTDEIDQGVHQGDVDHIRAF